MKNIVMKEVDGVGWIAMKPKSDSLSDLLLKAISISAIAILFAYAVVASIK